MGASYLPAFFTPDLERGKSILRRNKGRTSKERRTGKQERRFARIRERSAKDLASQMKGVKK